MIDLVYAVGVSALIFYGFKAGRILLHKEKPSGIPAALKSKFSLYNIPASVENGIVVVELKALAKLTSSAKNQKEEEKERLKETLKEEKSNMPEVNLSHPRLQKFYERYVKDKATIKGNTLKVIVSLLELLDKYGDCPSVVQNPGKDDHDSLRKKTNYDDYTALSKISLLDHSIDVAEKLIEMHGESLSSLPMDILMALGHDIGKIPAFSKKASDYTTGDHPEMSALLLSKIDGFNSLPYAEKVKTAVKKHHVVSSETYIENLRKADQKARAEELERIRAEELDINSSEGSELVDLTPQKKPENTELYLEGLDPDIIIARIKDERLNKIINGGFDAFSTKNGYVFVQAGVVMDFIKDFLAEKGLDIDPNDRELRQKILIEAAEIMRKKGYLAEEFVQSGYFSNKFKVIFKNRRPVIGIYMPFYASAFSSNINKLEKAKQGYLKDIQEVRVYADS